MGSYIKASMERSYAESFFTELERNDNQYFLFIGKGTPWSDENTPPEYTDTVSSEYQVMNDIIGYKKLSPENVLFAIPRYEWITGTVYDQYSDSLEMFDETDPKIFYVVTDENHVYKCLWNNGNRPSVVKPSLVITSPFTTEDGYSWKYLATVRESDLPYELTDYVPVDFAGSADTETTNQYNAQIDSVNSSITRIEMQNSPGASLGIYPNALHRSTTGVVVVSVASFSVDANNSSRKYVTVTDLDSRNRITNTLSPGESTDNYVGYVMRVNASTVNPREINNYGIITAIDVQANQIIFTVENDAIDFTVTPTANATSYSSVQILPYVKIMGDGSGAYAFPQMNSNRSIRSIEVVNGGRNYSNVRVQVTSHKAAGTEHPTAVAVRSPKGGHGSNILKELNVQDVLLVMKITEYDAQTIRGGGQYRQFGIIKNPVLNDGSGRIAGREDFAFRDITLVAPDGIYDTRDFDFGSGSLMIGTESYSSSRPIYINAVTDSEIVLKTANVSGSYISRQQRANDYELSVASSIVQFSVGEMVQQDIPAGVPIDGISYGFNLSVRGRVQEYSPQTLAVRLLSDGNFVSGYPVYGEQTGANVLVTGVTPRYGEYVWLTQTNGNFGNFVSVRSRGQSNNQKFYRVADVSQPYFDADTVPSYSGLTVLDIATSVSAAVGGIDTTSAPVIPTAFSNGDFVQQGVSGSAGHYASGTVYDWEYINPSRGRLYLTNVIGNFRSKESHPTYSGINLGPYIISSVQPSQIERTSGEVLYISNVRPITRTMGQEEEFRLRLGF